MINLRQAIRNVLRNKSKSLLIILVSIILVVFLMYYVFLLNANNYKLNKVYDTTDVVVKVERRDGSSMKKVIPYLDLRKIQEKSNLVGSAYYKAEYSCSFNENGTTSFEDMTPLIATSDINREIIVTDFSSEIKYASGYDENIFANATENVCLLSKELLDEKGWKLGETIKLYAPNEKLIKENIEDFIIVGVYDSASVSAYNNSTYKNAVFCAVNPFSTTAVTFYFTEKQRWPQEFVVSECEFILNDSRNVEEFKNYIKMKTGFYSESPSNDLIKNITLVIYDNELKDMIGPVQSITSFMEKALPVIFIIIGTIAFGIAYLMAQNRITDIALMRAMGIKGKKIFSIIICEMLILCLLGIIVGLVICLIIYPKLFITIPSISVIGVVVLIYILAFFIGNTIALSLILRLKPITVLTKKEWYYGNIKIRKCKIQLQK